MFTATNHHRASEVFDFFEEQGLTPTFLRRVSQRQMELLVRRFDDLDADPTLITRDRELPLERLGGFLSLRSPVAADLCASLKAEGVLTDQRARCCDSALPPTFPIGSSARPWIPSVGC